MRTPIQVDKDKLQAAIHAVEAQKKLPGFTVLCEEVAKAYNRDAENRISPQVVKARIQEWRLDYSTTSKKGAKKVDVDRAVAEAALEEAGDSRKSQTEVLEAAVLTYEQHTTRSISTQTLASRVEEWGLKINCKEPARQATAPTKSKYDLPVKSDVEASDSLRMCGCRNILIIAPHGDCPVKLTGTDFPAVEKWAKEVIAAGHKRGYHYAPIALVYYVRQFYDMHGSCGYGQDYLTVCGHLATIFNLQRTEAAFATSSTDDEDDVDMEAFAAASDGLEVDDLDDDDDLAVELPKIDLSEMADDLVEEEVA